jgi:PAS domain S-box-containing protein
MNWLYFIGAIICICLITISVIFIINTLSHENNQLVNSKHILIFKVIIIISILCFGWCCLRYIVNVGDAKLRSEFLNNVNTASALLDSSAVAGLRGIPADISLPVYHRLISRIHAYQQANAHSRYAYLFGKRGDDIIFLLDADEKGELPGTQYRNITPALLEVFNTGNAVIDPSTDDWGTWVSALVPIRHPDTMKIIAVFGIDISYDVWNRQLDNYRFIAIMLTLLLAAITAIVLWWQHSKHSQNQLQKDHQLRMDKLQACFLSFTDDPLANINLLTALCGELLNANCALYNRVVDGELIAWGQWQTPPGFIPIDSPEGHICFDVIKRNSKEIFIARDLQNTPYADTDPNVSKFNLQTYVGYPVIFNDMAVGSLCTVYSSDYSPTILDSTVISIIATAIGIEENRRQSENLLALQRDMEQKMASERDLNNALDYCLDASLRASGMDSGGVYLIDESQEKIELTVSRGHSEEFIQNVASYALTSDRAELLRNGQAIYREYNELQLQGLFLHINEGLLAVGIIPILHDNILIGSLNVGSHIYKDISNISRITLEAIASQIGSIVSRLRIEKKLQQREFEFQFFFNTIQDFLFILDERGNIIRVNPSVINRLGYSEDELIGQSVMLTHPAERRDEAFQIVMDMLAGKRAFCPIPLCAKDGTLIPVETVVTAGVDNGRTILVGISRDISERLRSDDALRQSEAKHQLLADNAGESIWTADLTGKIISSSAACFNIYGLQPEDIVSHTFHELLMPESNIELDAMLIDELNQEKEGADPKRTRVIEVQVNRKDDVQMWIEMTMTFLRNVNGLPIGILGVSRNIVERKLLLEKLHWNQELLQAMANCSPLAFFVVDNRTDVILYANHRFSEIWGLQEIEAEIMRGELTNGEVIPYCIPSLADVEAFAISCKPLQSEDNRIVVEDEIPFVDGRVIRRFSTQIRDELDNYFGRFYLFEDITDRKLAELEVVYRMRFEDLVATLSTRFINCPIECIDQEIINALGAIGTFVNADRSYIFLYSPDNVCMDNTHEWCADGINPEIDNLQQVPTDALPWWFGQLKSHHSIHIPCVADMPIEAIAEKEILQAQDIQSVVVIPLEEEGQVVGFLGFDAVRDEREWNDESVRLLTMVGDLVVYALIHKRIGKQVLKLQSDLEKHIQELAASNKELEAFTYSVSHDLRAPLWNIISFANLLENLTTIDLPEEMRDLIAHIKISSQRMTELIDAQLTLSRIYRESITPIPVSLSAMAQAIADTMQQAEPERKVTFNIAPDINITADPRLIRLALENLIGNAWKYTSKREHAIIDITTIKQNDEMVYCIRDNGAGFNMNYAEKLFTPFQRLHKASDFSGTGIGLATIQRIIHRHGGRIWAEGTVDVGAAFYFTINDNKIDTENIECKDIVEIM